MSETVFGLARRKSECHGHGDYSEVLSIRSLEPYGGPMPPVFKTEEKAQRAIEIIKEQGKYYVGDLEIVPMTLL